MISFFKQKGFICNNVTLPPQLGDNSIGFGDINEFVSYISNNNIKTILYCTTSETIEDYMITESTIKELGLVRTIEGCEQIIKEINKYNKGLEKIDFSKYITSIYFVLFNGFVLYYIVADDVPFLNPEDKLSEIVLSEEANITKEQKKRKEKITLLKEKLKQKILNDPKFFAATNKDLRRIYITDLLKNLESEYAPLKNHWINRDDITYRSARDFIETVWSEYKYANKK